MSGAGHSAGALVSRLGGWGQLALVLALVAAVAGGLAWERWRHPPVPAGATQVERALNVDLRQTTFRYGGTAVELSGFYREALPPRGWRYCGTQATPGCTNLPSLVNRPQETVEVYRRPDDPSARGPTVEIWPLATADGRLFVTVYETRGS